MSRGEDSKPHRKKSKKTLKQAANLHFRCMLALSLQTTIKMKTQKTLDEKIDSLKKGQSIKISGDETNYCLVERSGKGDILRFVRVLGNKQEIFKTIKN